MTEVQHTSLHADDPTVAHSPTSHGHSHAATTGQTANDHHAQAHAAAHKTGGADAVRLDELAVPTADVSMNSRKLTNVTDPSGAQDAATKSYVDAHGAAPATQAAGRLYAYTNFR